MQDAANCMFSSVLRAVENHFGEGMIVVSDMSWT